MTRWSTLSCVLSTLSAATLGCSSTCREVDETPVLYRDGFTNPAKTNYSTNDVAGPFLHFPPGRHYALVHRLDSQPVLFKAYLSFSEYPREVAESAGNQVLFDATTEEGELHVRNDTCSEFYLRVVAWASTGGAGSFESDPP